MAEISKLCIQSDHIPNMETIVLILKNTVRTIL